jgi:hypothetical protein
MVGLAAPSRPHPIGGARLGWACWPPAPPTHVRQRRPGGEEAPGQRALPLCVQPIDGVSSLPNRLLREHVHFKLQSNAMNLLCEW